MGLLTDGECRIIELKVLTEKEVGQIEFLIRNHPRIKEAIDKEYEDYKTDISCIEEIEKLLPKLKVFCKTDLKM